MGKLVLIDGNAILHRAYHALPATLTTRLGEPINAVYGFTSMLLRIIQDLNPTHIAVAFDRKEPTLRKKVFKEYQAQRPKMDVELSSQFEKTKAVLSAMNIPSYDKAGYEADDVIGTIATRAVQSEGVKEQESKNKAKIKTPTLTLSHSHALIDEVVIVTGDRDQLQLVNDKKGISVYLPVKGLSSGILMDEEKVVERIGVMPSQIIDYKGLVGDPSDNYKGVAGIGPKTAQTLISEYKNLKNIYKNLKKIPEKTAAKLKKDKSSADMSYHLAEIVTDVKIDFDIKESGKWQINSQKLIDMFADFGFKTLSKRVLAVGQKIDEEKQLTLL
ncbi:hypothetical protein M1545_03050 [Patescibacteria group bacterium]|nr:hypothetical protein [Patescibacteria group bacterium]